MARSRARKNRFKFKYLRQLKGFLFKVTSESSNPSCHYYWWDKPNGNGCICNNPWSDGSKKVFNLPLSHCKGTLFGELGHPNSSAKSALNIGGFDYKPDVLKELLAKGAMTDVEVLERVSMVHISPQSGFCGDSNTSLLDVELGDGKDDI